MSDDPVTHLKVDIKGDWLAALRSGQFQQGQGTLHDRQFNTYCCLGVLEKVCHIPASASGVYLNEAAAARVGLSKKTQHRLADKNDSGMTFAQIADYIETNL